MFTDFYGLTLDPFRLNPDPRFCYRHRNFSKAKAYMQYVLMQGEGFVMVTGQPGTGKTMLIQDLLADPSVDLVRRAHITSTQVGAEDLLRLVASAFGIDPRSASKASILLNLRAVLLQQLQTGHNSLIIVDEAQNLPFESIEELRMITNLQEGSRPLVQVFLIGQDSLRSLVSEPQMEQLRQRILAACRMEPLGPEETQAYLRYRLSCAGWTGRPTLTGAAVWQLHQASRGIPRLINAIAERLL
ncbi:MAG: AAA family ATPase, partial [Arenicellales bacterium]